MRHLKHALPILALLEGLLFLPSPLCGEEVIEPAVVAARIEELKQSLAPDFPRELVIQNRRILDAWPEATPDLFTAIGSGSESPFTAITAFQGECFSIRFREDSHGRFSCDEWWDGRNYFMRRHGRVLDVLEDGHHPFSPSVAFVRTSSDMGRRLFQSYLKSVASEAPVLEQRMGEDHRFVIRNRDGRELRAEFIALKEGLLIKRFSVWKEGEENPRYVNLIDGEPKALAELENAYRGCARYSHDGLHKILDVFSIRFLSFAQPLSAEAMGPQVELGTLVVDSRWGFGGKTPNYGWNGTLLPKEKALALAYLPSGENNTAIERYKKELAAKIAAVSEAK